jgi:FKBP-type peptidyl-prolyl cis-trans isomerase SlyD
MTPDRITDNVVVSLTYRLTLDDGELVEENDSSDPLVYLHGHDNIIPGLEQAVAGMAVGEKKQVVVEPADAYGEYDEEDYEEVMLEELPDDFKPEVGMLLAVSDSEEGEGEDEDSEMMGIITEISEDSLVLDFNHPLAGKRLHFEVTIIDLREADPEELEHGHVHDHGHNHHN